MQGRTLREIAAAVGAGLGSVSNWTRDIEPVATLLERAGAQPLAGRRLPVASMDVLRRCGRCGITLPACAFNRGQYRCRRCCRDYFRERGAVHRAQSLAALQRRRERAKHHLLAYLLAHPCVDCGEADPVVLEFDHVRGKTADVGKLAQDGAAPSRLDEEIAHCEVVCVCCHRRRTAARRPTPTSVRPGRARNAAYVAQARQGGCVDCGERDPLVLDFDHIGRKTSRIVDLVMHEASLERLQAELAQCVVRCAKCHRRRTAEVAGHFRSRQS